MCISGILFLCRGLSGLMRLLTWRSSRIGGRPCFNKGKKGAITIIGLIPRAREGCQIYREFGGISPAAAAPVSPNHHRQVAGAAAVVMKGRCQLIRRYFQILWSIMRRNFRMRRLILWLRIIPLSKNAGATPKIEKGIYHKKKRRRIPRLLIRRRQKWSKWDQRLQWDRVMWCMAVQINNRR